MNEITYKKLLSKDVYHYKIKNSPISKKRKPGQFVILRYSSEGERIPLTIVDSDPAGGTFDIIFQVVGKTTKCLAELSEGDRLNDVAGPLGNPTHIEKVGRCVMIGGGVGIAPLLPITKGFKNAGNEIVTILGARSKDILILKEEFEAISDNVKIATDDGSLGKKGFVSDILKEMIAAGEKIDFILAIGPAIMMKVIAGIAKQHNLKIMVSLNPIMLDGTGMCGGCRVLVDSKARFACVHGPEFDGSKVDFDGLIRRLSMFKEQEKHACQLDEKQSA